MFSWCALKSEIKSVPWNVKKSAFFHTFGITVFRAQGNEFRNKKYSFCGEFSVLFENLIFWRVTLLLIPRNPVWRALTPSIFRYQDPCCFWSGYFPCKTCFSKINNIFHRFCFCGFHSATDPSINQANGVWSLDIPQQEDTISKHCNGNDCHAKPTSRLLWDFHHFFGGG